MPYPLKTSRNRQKFLMKYGFDILNYVDLMANAKTDPEITEALNISKEELEKFKRNLAKINQKKKFY